MLKVWSPARALLGSVGSLKSEAHEKEVRLLGAYPGRMLRALLIFLLPDHSEGNMLVQHTGHAIIDSSGLKQHS